MRKGRKNVKFTAKQLANRRGPFAAGAIEYSHSGGQVCKGERLLWKLEVVIRFPAASSIIIHSALICHPAL
jgi:hypothetical protein